jgi:antibiotic biosynthesis monooxygenase (ABM) superfamily enzyme
VITTPASTPATQDQGHARPSGPIRWRLALLNVLAVYPVITTLIYVVFPLTEGWAIWQRTLVLAPIMVTTLVYGIAPRIQRHFGWFVTGKPRI